MTVGYRPTCVSGGSCHSMASGIGCGCGIRSGRRRYRTGWGCRTSPTRPADFAPPPRIPRISRPRAHIKRLGPFVRDRAGDEPHHAARTFDALVAPPADSLIRRIRHKARRSYGLVDEGPHAGSLHRQRVLPAGLPPCLFVREPHTGHNGILCHPENHFRTPRTPTETTPNAFPDTHSGRPQNGASHIRTPRNPTDTTHHGLSQTHILAYRQQHHGHHHTMDRTMDSCGTCSEESILQKIDSQRDDCDDHKNAHTDQHMHVNHRFTKRHGNTTAYPQTHPIADPCGDFATGPTLPPEHIENMASELPRQSNRQRDEYRVLNNGA